MSGRLAEALTTSRLRLRPWCVGDEHAIVALKTDPQVRLFLGGSVPPAKAIATTRSQIADQNWGHFVLADLAQDVAFGTVSFDRKRGPWELSFQLRPDRWGQGLMSEAVIAAADWFFANMDDETLIAVTQVANLRTRALLERVGATRSDTFEEHGVAQVQYRLSRRRGTGMVATPNA